MYTYDRERQRDLSFVSLGTFPLLGSGTSPLLSWGLALFVVVHCPLLSRNGDSSSIFFINYNIIIYTGTGASSSWKDYGCSVLNNNNLLATF